MNISEKKFMMRRAALFLILATVFEFSNLGSGILYDAGVALHESNLVKLAEQAETPKAKAAAGEIFLLWDTASGTVPSGWTCVSCAASDPFFKAFPRASSTYGNATSGADTVTHTLTFSSAAAGAAGNKGGSGSTDPTGVHTHTWGNPALTTDDIKPPYQDLEIIKAATTTLPAGAIGMFDVASSSLPSDWSYYSAMANNYLRGANDNTAGGAATHVHTTNATTTSGAATSSLAAASTRTEAADGHTHTIANGSSLASDNNAPPFITIVFGKLNATAVIGNNDNGLIAMFDNASVPANWNIISTSGSAYAGNLLQGSSTASTTGGSSTHSHGGTVTWTSSGPSATSANGANTGSNYAGSAHTHAVTYAVSSASSLPTYRDVILGKFTAPVPDATSVTYTQGGDGAKSGDSITITGTNFGTVSAGSRANCSGGSGTGCVKFIVGGTDTVADPSVTAWSATSITFTVSSTLASNGGASALQVWAAAASDTTPLTFYVYPNITAVSSLQSNAARTYNASDTDGLVYLTGDHFNTAGTSTMLGASATQHNVAEGVCSVSGFTSSTACYEMPPAIATTTYTGAIWLTRTSDSKQASSTNFRVLPRITSNSPTSTIVGTVVQILGNHFCESGTCPVSPNRATSSDNVKFGSTTSTDADFQNLTGGAGACNGSGAAWTDTEICVKVPSGTPTGSASTTVVSNTYSSNAESFTVNASPTPGTPGTPTYSSVASSTLTVGWATSTNSDYYKIERATSTEVYLQITTTTANSYGDTGRTPNTKYFYRVRGTNNGGDGPYSATSSQLMYPDMPTVPTYASITSSTYTINWSAPTGGADYYKIERATSSQVFVQTATTTTAGSYSETGRSANTTYIYRLRSTNATGDSGYTATSSVLTLPDKPDTPTYTNISTSTLTVNFTSSTGGAAYYKIERATSTQVYLQVTTTTGNTYNDSGLSASTTYFYRERGTNATGDGSYSASSSVTTASTASNSAPNAPSQDSPANATQDNLTSPVFKMTATDPDSDNLQYKVTIYSNSGCTTVVQANDQTSSQTGWSGQNASSSAMYTSGTQGTYTTQSALSQNTTYYWKASAKDTNGSNTWTDSSSCNNFTTTFGNFTTDSGSWSISSSQLTVTPAANSSVQIHAAGQSASTAVVEFKAKSSAVGANTGNTGSALRADSGSNKYWLAVADVLNQKHSIGKTVTGTYSVITSSSLTFSANTFYEFRGYLSGTSLTSWVNGATALSTTDSALSGSGFVGLAASSTAGTAVFTYDNFAVYTSPTITFNSLPSGGSWAVRSSTSTIVSGCQTGGSWDSSTYTSQIPFDYDNGGGSVAVWTGNSTCNGTADATYPASGLATDIFGGDTYAYSTSTVLNSGTVIATSAVTVSASGLITF